jgi:pentatricopeptide repeat protein
MYNSLIMCYTRRHEPDMAVKILREMREEGFEPDIVLEI